VSAQPHGEPAMRAAEPGVSIGVGVSILAILAMAVDHLMGSDPGLEDPPAFLTASGLSVALAAFLFARVVPRATEAGADRAARNALTLSVLALVPGLATLWLGLPFVLAGAGVALGLTARDGGPSRRATAAIAIGAIALLVSTTVYVVQAIEKLA
jgi:hypothetical protein